MEARESINPRALQSQNWFELLNPYTVGFVAYTDGINADIQMLQWPAMGTNTSLQAADFLTQYAGLYASFLDAAGQELFKELALGLEKAWGSSLVEAEGTIEENLAMAMTLEESAGPHLESSWRLQSLLWRAWTDRYIQLAAQTANFTEQTALALLERARELSPAHVAEAALSVLHGRAGGQERAEAFVRAQSLFDTIGLQLSVPLFQVLCHADLAREGCSLSNVYMEK